jgi:thiol:disulfide interchange protein DsbD
LYVDDKRDLPESEHLFRKLLALKLKQGDKWTDFMISKYTTQPLYVLTDLEGNSLNEEKPTISYVSIEEYGAWLKSEFLLSKKHPLDLLSQKYTNCK